MHARGPEKGRLCSAPPSASGANSRSGPADFGFDDYLRFNGSGTYWRPLSHKGRSYQINGRDTPLRDKEYMPDVMHRYAVDFITKIPRAAFLPLLLVVARPHADFADARYRTRQRRPENLRRQRHLHGQARRATRRRTRPHQLREKTLIVFLWRQRHLRRPC